MAPGTSLYYDLDLATGNYVALCFALRTSSVVHTASYVEQVRRRVGIAGTSQTDTTPFIRSVSVFVRRSVVYHGAIRCCFGSTFGHITIFKCTCIAYWVAPISGMCHLSGDRPAEVPATRRHMYDKSRLRPPSRYVSTDRNPVSAHAYEQGDSDEGSRIDPGLCKGRSILYGDE
jgi:hypothetical protein